MNIGLVYFIFVLLILTICGLLKLGLAFQIHDDIIDATSNAKIAGKPTNNDTSKNSFTNLLGVDEAIKIQNELESQIILEIQNKELKELISNLINRYLKG